MNIDKTHAIILAGGSGTRLWPMSRTLHPKHLIALNGSQSLLQQTASRIIQFIPPEQVLTVTYEGHQYDVKRHLGRVEPCLAKHVLCEPLAKNTLPAIAWAVAEVAGRDPDAMVCVFPSDHAIGDESLLGEAVTNAIEAAQEGYLVTFGIKPTAPETGYGYLKVGQPVAGTSAFRVKEFVEKPDLDAVLGFYTEDDVYWNSGMFVFKCSDFMSELEHWQPELHKMIEQIVACKNQSVLNELYSNLKNLSIDYGIMERSSKVALVPARFSWSDLGTWEALYRQGVKDSSNNVVQGNVVSVDSRDSLLLSRKGVLAAIGLDNIVAIQTEDAVVVSRRDQVQKVKDVVKRLKSVNDPCVEFDQTVYRPWGYYKVLEVGASHKVKRIVVDPGQKLSLQSHQDRSEHWVVIKGTAEVMNGEETFTLNAGESTYISKQKKHRLANLSDQPVEIIETQTGSYLGEDDIVRYDDIYGRK